MGFSVGLASEGLACAEERGDGDCGAFFVVVASPVSPSAVAGADGGASPTFLAAGTVAACAEFWQFSFVPVLASAAFVEAGADGGAAPAVAACADFLEFSIVAVLASVAFVEAGADCGASPTFFAADTAPTVAACAEFREFSIVAVFASAAFVEADAAAPAIGLVVVSIVTVAAVAAACPAAAFFIVDAPRAAAAGVECGGFLAVAATMAAAVASASVKCGGFFAVAATMAAAVASAFFIVDAPRANAVAVKCGGLLTVEATMAAAVATGDAVVGGGNGGPEGFNDGFEAFLERVSFGAMAFMGLFLNSRRALCSSPPQRARSLKNFRTSFMERKRNLVLGEIQ